MSAPHLIGLQKYGLGRVLSTISGMPAACAISAIASMSETMPSGFDTLSTNSALVLDVIACLKFIGSRGSTKPTCQSNCGKVPLICAIEPP